MTQLRWDAFCEWGWLGGLVVGLGWPDGGACLKCQQQNSSISNEQPYLSASFMSSLTCSLMHGG